MSASVTRLICCYADLKLDQPDQVKWLGNWFEQWKAKCVDVYVVTSGPLSDASGELQKAQLLPHCSEVISLKEPESYKSLGSLLAVRLKEGWVPREQLVVTVSIETMRSLFFDDSGSKRRLVLAHTFRVASRVSGFLEPELELLDHRITLNQGMISHDNIFNFGGKMLVDKTDNLEKTALDIQSESERKAKLAGIAKKERKDILEYIRQRPDFAEIAGVDPWKPEEDKGEGTATVKKKNTRKFGPKANKNKDDKPSIKRTITMPDAQEGTTVVILSGPMSGQIGKVIKTTGFGVGRKYRVETADGKSSWCQKIGAPEVQEDDFVEPQAAPPPPAISEKPAESPAKSPNSPKPKKTPKSPKSPKSPKESSPPAKVSAPPAEIAAPPQETDDEPEEEFPEGTQVQMLDGVNKGACGTVTAAIDMDGDKKYRIEMEAGLGEVWCNTVQKAPRPLKAKEAGRAPQEDWSVDKKKPLGSGAFGSVKKVTNKATGLVRAMKIIRKQQVRNVETIWKEVNFMKRLDHPNIIKCFETYEDARSIFLIMELCTGGELFDKIIDCGHFTEVEGANIMHQVLRGVYYMHSKQIAHRDLKPENFLLCSDTSLDKVGVKIIDFGISSDFPAPGETLKSFVGSVYYAAPEVLNAEYTEMADLWSFGVIVYVCLCGNPPFGGEEDAEIEAKVITGKYEFDEVWDDISPDAKDFVSKLLQMDWRNERLNAAQAMNHEWITKKAPRASLKRLESTVQRLQNFTAQCKFKKIALQVVAAQMSEAQIGYLRQNFQALDANGDGFLSLEELHDGLQSSGLKEKSEIEALMKQMDANKSGKIDYTEFLSAAIDGKIYAKEDMCWSAFKFFDKNGDGKITKEEVLEVLSSNEITLPSTEVEEMMREVTHSPCDEIEFRDFMAMMKSGL